MSIRKWLKRNKSSIAAGFLFIINCVLFCCEIYEKEIFIGFVASIATIYLGVIKYQIENDRFYLELFKNFNGRYDGDINDVFNGFENNTIQLDLEDKDKVKKLLIIDYFNLCAEEYYWYKQNRIPEEVWAAWKAGIEENLAIPQVGDLFLEEIKTERRKKSYYGLDKEVFVNKESIEKWRKEYLDVHSVNP